MEAKAGQRGKPEAGRDGLNPCSVFTEVTVPVVETEDADSEGARECRALCAPEALDDGDGLSPALETAQLLGREPDETEFASDGSELGAFGDAEVESGVGGGAPYESGN